jgi:1,4-dihydroxy-6-naphthoate synthase
MKLSLAYSPCPNDTFMFDAIAHNRIDTEGLSFDIHLADVESLNQQALAGEHDISKLSFHAYAYVSHQYALLTAGAALGRGCGPLLISKDEIPKSKIEFCLVGIPGRLTTANFLCTLAFPEAATKKEMVFSEIEGALLSGGIDIGLIIHENRFTYIHKGLRKIIDLGEWWESKYHMPIPLGGIAVSRQLPIEIQQKVDRVVRRSVAYAMAHPDMSHDYVCAHAQEMSPEVMQQHIQLYVNDFSVDLGEEGKAAIEQLYAVALEKKIIGSLRYPLFVDER